MTARLDSTLLSLYVNNEMQLASNKKVQRVVTVHVFTDNDYIA